LPNYEILLSHTVTLENPLWVGEAFRYAGLVWQVEKATPASGDEDMRLLLRLWPDDVPHPATIRSESVTS
jgi:hypothetical protein